MGVLRIHPGVRVCARPVASHTYLFLGTQVSAGDLSDYSRALGCIRGTATSFTGPFRKPPRVEETRAQRQNTNYQPQRWDEMKTDGWSHGLNRTRRTPICYQQRTIRWLPGIRLDARIAEGSWGGAMIDRSTKND